MNVGIYLWKCKEKEKKFQFKMVGVGALVGGGLWGYGRAGRIRKRGNDQRNDVFER